MLGNTVTSSIALLPAANCANTAAATGGWVAITNYEGTVIVAQNIGTVTAGQIAGKLRHADDGSGTNAADITGATFTAVTTSTDPACEQIRVNVDGLKPYIQYVGTITTGPVDCGVTLTGNPKY